MSSVESLRTTCSQVELVSPGSRGCSDSDALLAPTLICPCQLAASHCSFPAFLSSLKVTLSSQIISTSFQSGSNW
jgi:hypothetical protein